MGKLTRIKWPQEYSELQRIEELLLCGICYDYMDTSVMTSCSHNYCSVCIRKYLHYKTQCPACFQKTFEKDLHTNRTLDELISYFGKIRLKLVDCISGAKIETEEDEESAQESTKLTPVRPARSNQNQRKTPSRVEAKRVEVPGDVAIKTENVQPLDRNPQKLHSSPSTSGVKIATIFTPKSRKNVAGGSTLPCPVCRVDVSEVNINKHLDDCLKRETATQEPASNEPKRKPLPKLVFGLMTDTELRKKVKEVGLPTQGDRKILKARFQRYSTLYNAECDRKHPRPVEELLRQCHEEEALEKKMLKISQAANRLNVTRHSEQNIIEEAQKKYLESNKKNYQGLIASIREREKSRKPTAGRVPTDEDADDPSSEASENAPGKVAIRPSDDEDLNGELGSYSVNAYDANFQDSDSDSCPLQHYTSNDPVSFLSIEMSTSGNSRENSLKSAPPKSRADGENSLKTAPPKSPADGENSLDASASPAKNVTLGDDKMVLMPVKSLKNEADDVFNAAVDVEPNDEESAARKLPKATTGHSTKRAKLSPRKAQPVASASEPTSDRGKLVGGNLALSIARDFSFDTSSNESEPEEAQETVHTKSTDEPKAEARRVEAVEPELPNVDEKNHDSSTASSTAVDRPARKRNCVTRAQSAKATRSKDAEIAAPEETPRTSADERENLSSATRIDSPVKRRRRRKIETAAAAAEKNPPSRPFRKRNSVVKDINVHQRP